MSGTKKGKFRQKENTLFTELLKTISQTRYSTEYQPNSTLDYAILLFPYIQAIFNFS